MLLERSGELARLILPDGRIIEVAGANAVVHGNDRGMPLPLSPVAQEIISAIILAFSGGDA